MIDAHAGISGVLIIDKPAGPTSHDIVARVRRILGIRQVGHFGTLDPFATGVLPVSVGKATRFAQFYLKSRKAYEGTIRFGFSTDTYDSTGQPTSESSPVVLDRDILEKIFREFTGRLMQTPPPFSAKHVGGVRAYELARQQKPVLLGIERQDVQFAVECSGGTYVRSLAHDLGQKVRCGAYLAGLRRTGVAEFKESQAVTLDRLAATVEEKKLENCLVPLEALLPEFPELVVRGRQEVGVRHGHAFELAQSTRASRGANAGCSPVAALLKILNAERRLIAIARHVEGSVYHPGLVLV